MLDMYNYIYDLKAKQQLLNVFNSVLFKISNNIKNR